MLAVYVASLLTGAAMAAAVPEPTEQLPPIDATRVADNTAAAWQLRRLPSAESSWTDRRSDWPDRSSVTADAFSTAPYVRPPGGEGLSVTPVTYPRALSEPLLQDIPQEPPAAHVSSFKNSVFQKISLTAAWLNRNGPGEVGVTEVQLFGSLAFPLPTPEKPLVITPGFGFYFVDGPNNAVQDLPSQVYDAYLEFRWINKINDRWLADLAVSPGVHSDFEHWDDSALRITGRAIAVYTWGPRLKIILGVIYLDRDDVSMLPAAGIIWTPSDDWSLELVSPRPRIAWRLWYVPEQREDWIYVAGELGGGSWSVERASLVQDVVTSRDYRVLIGVERKRPGGAGARFEAGWVFNREIEYASPTPMITPDATVMIRGGIVY